MTLTDISFAEGKVGQAFSLNGYSSYLKAANSLASTLAQGEGLTISTWIKPSDISGLHPIIMWHNYGSIPYGVELRIGHQPGDQGVIYGNFFDAGNNLHELISPQGIVGNNTYQHVALTYDKASGLAFLYVNGAVVAQDQLQSPVPFNSITRELWIGRFFGDQPGSWSYNRLYAGLLDEISIYNRALSAVEIREECEKNHPN